MAYSGAVTMRDLRFLLGGGLAVLLGSTFLLDDEHFLSALLKRTGIGGVPVSVARKLGTDSTNCIDPEAMRIAIFDEVAPSVVNVDTFSQQRNPFSLDVMEVPSGTGSGYVWDLDGHIVTNHHVVKDASKAQVVILSKSNGPDDGSEYTRKEYEATVVGVDPFKDIAVLKIDAPAQDLRPIPRGESSTGLKVGQHAIAIGNPFGLDHTLTSGVISGLDREMMSQAGRPISHCVQTDAAVNPGNSGGPLLNSEGKLIGMNTMIYSPSGAFSGIGFAIPVDTVKTIASALIKHGRVIRPIIGITFLSGQQAKALGIANGVLVLDVPLESNAAKAGLRGTTRSMGWLNLGDIIVQCEDDPINSEADLFKALEKYQPGDKVKLTVKRFEASQTTRGEVKMVEAEIVTKLQSSERLAGEKRY